MENNYNENEVLQGALEYFNGDKLAADVWCKKYALKNNDEWKENTPLQTIDRIKNEIIRMENNYSNPMSNDIINKYLDNFKYFIPGGSILFGLGNNYTVSSLGNCFFIDNNADSYGGIFNIDESMVQLMKRRGGVGITIENYRPINANVNNAASTSTGSTSFMNRFSSSTREVAQDGRRGALMLAQHIAHPDIKSFIMAKDDVTQLTGANVSVKITDEFMHCVENNDDYILRWPISDHQPIISEQIVYNKLYKRNDNSYIMKVKAREIWDMIIKQAHKNAEPGILFWDSIIKESPADCYAKFGFVTKGTNPCVTGNTNILTKEGNKIIRDCIGKVTTIWNGSLWTSVIPKITGKTKLWYDLIFDNDSKLTCTKEHIFYKNSLEIVNDTKIPLSIKCTAEELKKGDNFIYIDDKLNRFNVKLIKISKRILENEELTYCFTEPLLHKGVFNNILTGQCGEVPLSPYDSCRLGSIILSSIIDYPFTDKAKINFKLLEEITRFAQRFMDDIVSLEEEKINIIISKIESDPEDIEIRRTELNLWKNVRKVLLEGRRTGIGVLGLGDMLAQLGIIYGSKEATKIINKIFETIAVSSYKESVQLAKERGAFPIWSADLEAQNPFIIRVISNHFNTKEYNDYLTYGRRNIANLSIAPTGSLAILSQTTSGIEPLFKCYYKRRRKINPNENNVKIDFKDDNGDCWQEYYVFHSKFLDWFKSDEHNKQFTNEQVQEMLSLLPENELNEIISRSPWKNSESHNINYIEKINMQGVIQKWIDHSISVTHNLPENISVEEVGKIYMQAWKSGCKGCTIYREGSRAGVLITNNTNNIDDFKQSNAPHRPKELKADYYVATANGIKFAVIVGLWKNTNKPYEIFAFENPPMDKNTDGKIIKIKKGQYKFINHEFEIDNLQLAASRIDEKAHTIFLSMLLRHGAPIEHIINVAKKVDENITSFSSVCRRILSKYIAPEILKEKCPDCGNDLVREEGCIHCVNCGYSKCS